MAWSRTNQLIIAAAERLGVRAEPLASVHSDFFLRLIGPDERAVIISKTRSPFLTEVAQTLSNNKFIARELLAGHGLPVNVNLLLDEASDPAVDPQAAARARALGRPPARGRQAQLGQPRARDRHRRA